MEAGYKLLLYPVHRAWFSILLRQAPDNKLVNRIKYRHRQAPFNILVCPIQTEVMPCHIAFGRQHDPQ